MITINKTLCKSVLNSCQLITPIDGSVDSIFKTTMARKISYLLQKLELVSKLQIRACATVPRFKLLDNIEKSIGDDKIKARKHPGINKHIITELPEWISTAIRQNIEDSGQSQVLEERIKFSNYLFSRRLPAEEEGLKQNYYEVEKQFLGGTELENLTDEEVSEIRKKISNKVKKKLKQSVFNWKPLDYNGYRSLLYTVSRSAAEYSVLNSIFKEINKRDPKFNPTTVFDFGSGVGTVLWAAIQYWKKINEYVGIDISEDMHTLAEKIMSHSPTKMSGIYYRRYLPVSNLRYELVVSAYTLMDLADARCRLETLSKLWTKTNNYLVIVEQGTRAGFELINEARDFIKYMAEKSERKSHLFNFAPCPHDLPCPRYAEHNTPCNFLTQYKSLSVLGPSKPTNELYSYIVIKKGTRTQEDSWYRSVRPTIARSRHARCRLCTTNGKLQEVVFTASKYGKPLYRCAKVTSWGDRLPIQSTTDPTEFVQPASNLEVSSNNIDEKNESFEDEDSEEEKEEEMKQVLCSDAPNFTRKDDA